MAFELKPLHPALGAEIVGLDLHKEISAEDQKALNEAFLTYHLLLVRGQELTAEEEVRFAEIFGPVSYQGGNMKHGRKIMHISNVEKDGAFPTGELLFHSDHVFFEHPLRAIALYGEIVPEEGGDTLFANAAMAWDNLPDELRAKIDGRSARHVYDYAVNQGNSRFSSKSVNPDAPQWVHPINWRHPQTGRSILMVNRLMTDEIIGMDQEEADELLSQLFEYIEDENIVYRHKWQLHDLVIWDNRTLQHARTNFDPNAKRSLRRVPIGEEFATA